MCLALAIALLNLVTKRLRCPRLSHVLCVSLHHYLAWRRMVECERWTIQPFKTTVQELFISRKVDSCFDVCWHLALCLNLWSDSGMKKQSSNPTNIVSELIVRDFTYFYFVGKEFLVKKVAENQSRTFRRFQSHFTGIRNSLKKYLNLTGQRLLSFSTMNSISCCKNLCINQRGRLQYNTRDAYLSLRGSESAEKHTSKAMVHNE